MKKALGETQTLRAGRSNAEPTIFAPPQTPSRGHRTAKNESAGDGHYLHLQTQFGENQCTQLRVIVVTDPHTNNTRPPIANKQTGLITIHCTTKLIVQCNQKVTTPTWNNLSGMKTICYVHCQHTTPLVKKNSKFYSWPWLRQILTIFKMLSPADSV